MEIICFHNPEEENGYLSNWYLSDFSIDGIKFSSMEQYMMYQKASCFHDEEIANKILHTDNVARIKQMGRAVKNMMTITGVEYDRLLYIRDFRQNFLRMRN